MTYLLDVNALVALGFSRHEFHLPIADWIRDQQFPALATCSITELGFVRVLAQAPAYECSVDQAKTLLLRLKEAKRPRFVFFPDAHGVSHLPEWVRAPRQTTDGHLARLAQAHGGTLATFDRNIPESLLIPSPAGW